MSNHTDEFVGRSFSASIGEPWDFESDAGPNRLDGRVTDVSTDAEFPWRLCTVSVFRNGGRAVTTVAIVDRYATQDGLLRRLARGERVGANFVYDPLARLYRDEIEARAKDGLAVAIAAVADDDVIDEVVALARDVRHGPSRLLLLSALERSSDPRARVALVELQTDPELRREIRAVLQRLKRAK